MPIIIPASGYNITIQSVVNWARTFVDMSTLSGFGAVPNEPAITIANNVMQEIIAEPFGWWFNRKSAADFDTVANTLEYTLTNVTDIGWIERAQREEKASTATIKPIYDLLPVRALPRDFMTQYPLQIAKDREASNNTVIRLWPVPDSIIWTIKMDYQIKTPLKSSLTDFWNPIPDELAFVYRQGFLAEVFKHAKDYKRYELEYKKFLGLIHKALGYVDQGQSHEGFVPSSPIMMG